MNVFEQEIARCEDQKKALEAQLLSIEQQKHDLDRLPLSDPVRQSQAEALTERENIVRAGLDRTEKDLGQRTVERDAFARVVAEAAATGTRPGATQEAAQDQLLAEQQARVARSREEQGVELGDEVSTAAEVIEQTTSGTQAVLLPEMVTAEQTAVVLDATLGVIGAAVVIKDVVKEAVQSAGEWFEGRTEWIEEAIKDTPQSEQQRAENDVRAEIQKADNEKWHQHQIEKVEGSREKEHAGIEYSYGKEKERVTTEQAQARKHGDEDRAKQCDDKLRTLEEQRDHMLKSADREANARLEELQRAAAERQMREMEERQRQDRDGR